MRDESLVINRVTSTLKSILENWINGSDRIGFNPATNPNIIPDMDSDVKDGSSGPDQSPTGSTPERINLSDRAIMYGIRRYLRGATLNLHVDRVDTHIISAILQLDQVTMS